MADEKPKNKPKERPKLTEHEQHQKLMDILEKAGATNMRNTYALAWTLWKSGYYKHLGSPAGVMAVIMKGKELGVAPITSLSEIQIIEGKPACSSQLIAALAKRAGVKIEILERTAEKCHLKLTGSDGNTYESIWTIEDAKRAGLAGGQKHNWNKYPKPMLYHRTLSDGVRVVEPGAIMSLHTLDEITDGQFDQVGQLSVQAPVEDTEIVEEDPDKSQTENLADILAGKAGTAETAEDDTVEEGSTAPESETAVEPPSESPEPQEAPEAPIPPPEPPPESPSEAEKDSSLVANRTIVDYINNVMALNISDERLAQLRIANSLKRVGRWSNDEKRRILTELQAENQLATAEAKTPEDEKAESA